MLNLPSGDAYGAIELKQAEHRNMTWALAIAGLLHVALVGAWWLSTHLGGEEPPSRTVRVMKYSELGPPPSVSSANAPASLAVKMPTAPIKPKIAVPVPVPDEKATPEQTIPTQEEVAAPVADAGDGAGAQIQQDIAVDKIESDAPPPDFVAFEKEPQVVHRIEPGYPEAAKQSGIEGAVFAKLWIDKEGKVKDVVILKSPSDLFNEAVIDAAKRWLFTPAVMNSGPVAVWFPVKFSFHLSG